MSGGLRGGPGLATSVGLARPPGRRSRVVPLLALLLLPLLWVLWQRDDASPADPTTLDGWVIDGPRQAGCLRLVLGVDDSGSMADFASARDAALGQFLAWVAQDNLRGDDELAVVDFALEAVVRLPPSPVSHATRGLARPPVVDDSDTLLAPVLATVSGFPASDCRTVLVLLSDGQLADLPTSEAAGRNLLRDARVDEIRLLVPGERIDVPAGWTHAFPAAAPAHFDGHDSDDTAITFGRTVADIVDQRLVPRGTAS